MFSKMVTDLANEILLSDQWNPSELHNPDQPEMPTPTNCYPTPQFGKALPMAVNTPLSSTARIDGFIDGVFLNTEANRGRALHATCH
jgi:hypothetical protein